MDKQDKNVEQLRADRERAVASGDQAKVAELDQQINAAGQPGSQTSTGQSGTAPA